jgi:hypothetical protein
MPQVLCAPCQSSRSPLNERDLYERVRAEFREMPGLKLTLLQASRLFDVEPLPCERVLTGLVDSGQLATDGKVFARPLC